MKKNLSIIILSLLTSACIAQTKDLFPEHQFTSGIEGPVIDNQGNIYAVNFAQEGTIGKITSDGKTSLFATLPQGSTGNALIWLSNQTLLVADYSGHNVLTINMKNGKIDTLCHGPNMNQPNDIVRLSNGLIYASDPNWGKSTGNIWLIEKNNATCIEANMGTTNGIEKSPDEKLLYVNESIQRNIWSYTINKDGKLSNKKLFYHFENAGMDGMKCDEKGNLYIARYDNSTVDVLSPAGKLIKQIKLKGQKPTNLVFGGKDGKTIYITMQDRGNIEVYQNDIKGARR